MTAGNCRDPCCAGHELPVGSVMQEKALPDVLCCGQPAAVSQAGNAAPVALLLPPFLMLACHACPCFALCMCCFGAMARVVRR